jgi:hypothetical protein
MPDPRRRLLRAVALEHRRSAASRVGAPAPALTPAARRRHLALRAARARARRNAVLARRAIPPVAPAAG